MNKDLLKKLTPYLIALGTFILIAIIYCSPILEGKVLQAGDTLSWKGMYQENKAYTENTGEHTFWTGSMFSGMPNYQIGGGEISSTTALQPISKLTRMFSNGPLQLILTYLIGFFILLRSFKLDKWLALIGAIAIAFSSYFFIIIEAGHITKAVTIGLMAPIIGGFFLIFNKKYVWGVIFTLIYSAIALLPHVQMTYYFFMLIGCLFFAELFIHIKEKRFKDLVLGIVLFVAAVGIGFGTQFTKMQLNKEYVTETDRKSVV